MHVLKSVWVFIIILLLAGCEEPSGPQFVDVAVGGSHMLALTKKGTVWSWGGNYNGELGRGGVVYQDKIADAPAPIDGLPRVVEIEARQDESYALSKDGFAYGWGDNETGQILDSPDSVVRNHRTPIRVLDSLSITQISLGTPQTAAITREGDVFEWTSSDYIISKINSSNYLYKVVVDPVHPKCIAAGAGFTILLGEEGNVVGWGDNESGVLGISDRFATQPVFLDTTGSVKTVDAGLNHVAALSSNGEIIIWGSNDFGQLGNASEGVYKSTVSTHTFEEVVAGELFTLALTHDGRVYSWGDNRNGQLGHSPGLDLVRRPKLVSGLPPIQTIAAGLATSAAIDSSGVIYTWGGTNEWLELGRADSIATESPITTPAPVELDPSKYPDDLSFDLF